jgi:hypothetical protein
MKHHGYKQAYGMSPFAVLVDWWEVEHFGGSANTCVGPKGSESSGDETVIETRTRHWCMVEGVFQAEQWDADRIKILKSLMLAQSKQGKWWRDTYPAIVCDAITALEEPVQDFYRFKRLQ